MNILAVCRRGHGISTLSTLAGRLGGTACASFAAGAASMTMDDDSLVVFQNVSLRYPSTEPRVGGPMSQGKSLGPLSLKIFDAERGGHVLVGKNGSGKSLISSALESPEKYLTEGSIDFPLKDLTIQHVSFESHQELLEKGGTVYVNIARHHTNSGNLDKATQFLVVRFGIFPLLHRDVRTLSTGEIRKVLLVRALSTRPDLLVLENAFDGLDIPTRDSLHNIVSRTLAGFPPDLLIQGVSSANYTVHTQVLLITHRPEEVVHGMKTFTALHPSNDINRETGSTVTVITEPRKGRSAEEMFRLVLTPPAQSKDNTANFVAMPTFSTTTGTRVKKKPNATLDEQLLPAKEDILKWWNHCKPAQSSERTESILSSQDLQVLRYGGGVKDTKTGKEDGGEEKPALLLDRLSWTIKQGERWLLAGRNGSGKSTLSRLVAREEDQKDSVIKGALSIFGTPIGESCSHDTSEPLPLRPGVGWASTELHMSLARSQRLAGDILLHGKYNGASDGILQDAKTLVRWFGMEDANGDVLERPFAHLSQGQQKLFLIAAAIQLRPRLLILDEPCQGLDPWNRYRVLGLINRLCEVTSDDMTLVYITHHLNELLPSLTHALQLREGRELFQGPIKQYDTELLGE